MLKTCVVCEDDKPLDDFNLEKAGKFGRRGACKICERLRRKDYNRKELYGVTPEEYRRLVAEQNGLCWICQKEPSNGEDLCVDHCHATDEVRGLLCKRCNLAIGILGDTAEKLSRAVDYLSRDTSSLLKG